MFFELQISISKFFLNDHLTAMIDHVLKIQLAIEINHIFRIAVFTLFK